MAETALISLGPISARITCSSELKPTLRTFPSCENTTRDRLSITVTESHSAIPNAYETRRASSGFRIQTPFYRGYFRPDTSEAELELAPVDANLETQHRRMYGGLRCILSLYLTELGGAALHGCAVRGEEGAHVFLGKTGAGKTTLASTATQGNVLGDDLVAILPDGTGQFKVCGTPFAGREGMVSTHGQYSLKTLSLLTQSIQTRLETLEFSEGVRGILDHFFVFDESLQTRTKVLKTAYALAKSTTCFRSHVSLSTPIWDMEEMR